MKLLVVLIATVIQVSITFMLPANRSMLQHLLPLPMLPPNHVWGPLSWPAIGEQIAVKPRFVADIGFRVDQYGFDLPFPRSLHGRLSDDLGNIMTSIEAGPALIGPDPMTFESGIVTIHLFFYGDWGVTPEALLELIVLINRWSWDAMRDVPHASLGPLHRGEFVAQAGFKLELHHRRDRD